MIKMIHLKQNDTMTVCGQLLEFNDFELAELPDDATCHRCTYNPENDTPLYPTEDTPTQLRKQVYAFFLDGIKEVPANPSARTDAILALFTTAQLQLVTELEASLKELPQLRSNKGYVYSPDQVEALLEHKKQELERGK